MKNQTRKKEAEKILYRMWEEESNNDLTALSFEEWKKVVEPDIGQYNFK